MGINPVLETSINNMTQSPLTKLISSLCNTVTLETSLLEHEPSVDSLDLNHSIGKPFPTPKSS